VRHQCDGDGEGFTKANVFDMHCYNILTCTACVPNPTNPAVMNCVSSAPPEPDGFDRVCVTDATSTPCTTRPLVQIPVPTSLAPLAVTNGCLLGQRFSSE
jgi:hypothetical protein